MRAFRRRMEKRARGVRSVRARVTEDLDRNLRLELDFLRRGAKVKVARLLNLMQTVCKHPKRRLVFISTHFVCHIY